MATFNFYLKEGPKIYRGHQEISHASAHWMHCSTSSWDLTVPLTHMRAAVGFDDHHTLQLLQQDKLLAKMSL